MRSLFLRRAAFVLLTASIALLPAMLRADIAELSSKLETLMKVSGYKSANKANDTTWTLDFNGKQIPKFKVVVTVTEKDSSGILTAITNPVPKDQMPRNRTNLSAALLKANTDFDYVKVGFDKDGDVFVRADMPPSIDIGSFKTVVEQVAAAADELYGRIKQSLR
jgi:hypothetical protein